MENPIRMHDLEVPLFLETPNIHLHLPYTKFLPFIYRYSSRHPGIHGSVMSRGIEAEREKERERERAQSSVYGIFRIHISSYIYSPEN